MKALLIFAYLITIADAYYTTLFIEPKEPPQFQLSQVSVQASESVR